MTLVLFEYFSKNFLRMDASISIYKDESQDCHN